MAFTLADVQSAFPELEALALIDEVSGQKRVVRCVESGKEFVLKLVSQTGGTSDPTALGRLEREIDLLNRAASPHLPAPGPLPPGHRVVAGTECIYYTEAYVPGRNVRQILAADGPMPVGSVACLGIQVARALEALWGLGVIHRDVKPANIIVEPNGHCVLIDPGFALALAEPSLTMVGGIVGTAPYYSPEHLDLINKRKMDVRADMYCLGIVMYEALSGRHPYFVQGMTWEQVCDHVIGTRPASPVTGSPDAETAANIVLRLLEKNPHLRYRNPVALIEDLLPLCPEEKP